MSAAPERREPIDIDEFERRLRGPEPMRRPEDPLAELARLVGGQNPQAADPFAELFSENFRKPAPPVAAPPVAPPVPPNFAPPPPPFANAPSYASPPAAPAAPEPDPFADFPDLRPLLRGADHGDAPLPPAASAPVSYDYAPPAPPPEVYPDDLRPSAQYEDWAEVPELAPDAPELEAPRERSKKPLYVAAAVIAAGFVAIGATLAWRGGAHQASGVATIAASPNPTKIQPKDEGGDKVARESTMLERTAAPPVKKVVSREEQPMDVAAAAKSPRIIPLGEDNTAPAGPAAGAASVPPVAPPAPSAREPVSRSAFPEPKRVKTVSVRADGSIIGGDAAPAAAAPPKPVERPAPARNSTPKSAARADATTTAAPAPKPAAKPKPKPHVAAVKPQQEAVAPAAEPAEEEAPRQAASGAYAVQVASAGSEAEARQTATRLAAKLSGALGGRHPSVIKASGSLYRVRVTGLSRESANAMCGRVKAAGGACFVAR